MFLARQRKNPLLFTETALVSASRLSQGKDPMFEVLVGFRHRCLSRHSGLIRECARNLGSLLPTRVDSFRYFEAPSRLYLLKRRKKEREREGKELNYLRTWGLLFPSPSPPYARCKRLEGTDDSADACRFCTKSRAGPIDCGAFYQHEEIR